MSKLFYTRNSEGLTIYRDGRSSLVSKTADNFSKILTALQAKDFDLVEKLMNKSITINKSGKSKLKGRRVFVRNGQVFYIDSHKKERELHGALVDRILDDLDKPHGVKFGDALIRFMDNMMKNPIKDIRQELYEWLMSGKSPITMDGCFLAYKKVRGDFMDIYSGTMDNSPGKIPRMKQDDVDTNREQHCSRGLHFCSRGYLSSYQSTGGYKVVIVKVNPRHVFAIPTDYQFQKGRASEYFVVGEYKGSDGTDAFKDSFVDEDTKQKSMPDVEFVGKLKPSLEMLAESYGLVKDGRVLVWKREFNHGHSTEFVVVIPEKGNFYTVKGDLVQGEVVEMSFKTKSVREAVKKSVKSAERVYLSKD